MQLFFLSQKHDVDSRKHYFFFHGSHFCSAGMVCFWKLPTPHLLKNNGLSLIKSFSIELTFSSLIANKGSVDTICSELIFQTVYTGVFTTELQSLFLASGIRLP